MANHELREEITLILVNEALEANGRVISEAALHLLDAAGTLILHNLKGDRAVEMARAMAGYLVDQVVENSGGVK
ncbi:MAG: hypothetical protein VX569_00345 [Pseudomonadota bacterium]|nr:hypothetical protein [Pseudomonadota bacterium]